MTRLLLALVCFAAPLFAAAQEAPTPILRTELESQTVLPSQAVELRLTVLVPTWLPEPPVFPSFEAPNLVVRAPAGASLSTNERVDGTMAYTHYERLSAMDAMFLELEDVSAHMHIGSAAIFEAGALCGPDRITNADNEPSCRRAPS